MLNTKEHILGFQGDYRWLSNFAPVSIVYDDVVYPSVENAYVAAKTTDIASRVQLETCSPATAKSIGKTLVLRSHWEQLKVPLMYRFLCQKYNSDPYKTLLIGTVGQYIEETNGWQDRFWGVCDGRGQNILGKLIMKIRDELTCENFDV